MGKTELIASLKPVKPVERKAYSLRVEIGMFHEVEIIAENSGKSINDVLNALIEIGLSELKGSN